MRKRGNITATYGVAQFRVSLVTWDVGGGGSYLCVPTFFLMEF
jgi:hypothetical protein